jgi:hypothetical protein
MEATGRAIPLPDSMTLGRRPDSDLVLEDAGCSGRHARIHREGDRWVVEDLGSTNGTWLNDQRLEGPRVLRDGDRLQLGGQVLRVAGLLSGTLVMPPPVASAARPPVLSPPLPPPVPPPVPPPARPAAPPRRKKRRGCWTGCCLASLVLLILAAVAGWFLWKRFAAGGARPQLSQALAFREQARFDAPGARTKWATPEGRARLKDLDDALFPTINPGLGWAFFFETSVAAPGTAVEDRLPVLFYNPWADVALVTVWDAGSRLADVEAIAGECLRRTGEAPFGGGRRWMTLGAYGPAAVGGLTARTLLAFEQGFRAGAWSPASLRGRFRAWQEPRNLEASRLACGLQLAQTFQELTEFSGSPARKAYVDLLSQGAHGQAAALVATAAATPPESGTVLKALPPGRWAAFKVAAFCDLGDRVLVMAHHSESPDLFLGLVLARTAQGLVPQRMDALSFQACYTATR